MSEPVLTVDLLSATPPYAQLREQVRALVATGLLRPGDRLPTVRALASRLGVATGTVARAYRELEADGLVASRRRTGTVVAAAAGPALRRTGEEDLRRAADAFAAAAVTAGVDDEHALTLARGALARARAPVASPP